MIKNFSKKATEKSLIWEECLKNAADLRDIMGMTILLNMEKFDPRINNDRCYHLEHGHLTRWVDTMPYDDWDEPTWSHRRCTGEEVYIAGIHGWIPIYE